MNITNVLWQPQFIKLTHIEIVGPASVPEHTCYVDPSMIIYAVLQNCRITRDEEVVLERMATLIMLTQDKYLYVEESPDEVARLRDAAFGYTAKLRAVE